AARRRPVHGPGDPRRGRRHQPVRLGAPAASWAGLTPTVRGSDRVAHYGHISKEGSVWLRWVLCEAARTAKRSPQFTATFQRIAERRGRKIATTAVAPKLLTPAWHLLTEADQAAAPHPPAPPLAARRPPPPG